MLRGIIIVLLTVGVVGQDTGAIKSIKRRMQY